MPFPNPPTISSDPYSYWWTYSEGGQTFVCSTHAAALVRKVQQKLGLAQTGVWDAVLQDSLIANASLLDSHQPGTGWASVRAALQADRDNQTVSRLSEQMAVYLAYYKPWNRLFNGLTIQPSGELIQWGIAPPVADDSSQLNSGEIVCFAPDVDTVPELLTSAQRATAVNESSTGVRIGPGRAGPTTPVVTTPGVGGGVSGGELLLVGLAFVSLVALLYVAQPVRRRNPRRHRRRVRR